MDGLKEQAEAVLPCGVVRLVEDDGRKPLQLQPPAPQKLQQRPCSDHQHIIRPVPQSPHHGGCLVLPAEAANAKVCLGGDCGRLLEHKGHPVNNEEPHVARVEPRHAGQQQSGHQGLPPPCGDDNDEVAPQGLHKGLDLVLPGPGGAEAFPRKVLYG